MLPPLKHIAKKTAITDVFYGYNHRLKIGDGESYDEKNLTSDYFPVMSPSRGDAASNIQLPADSLFVSAMGTILDKICVIKSDLATGGNPAYLYIYEEDGDMYGRCDLSGLLTHTPQMVMMGTKICLFPDGIVVDISSYTTVDDVKVFTAQTMNVAEITSYPPTETAKVYQATVDDIRVCDTKSSTPPATPHDGDLYTDTNSDALYRYSAASDTWTRIYDMYTAVYFPIDPDHPLPFNAGDCIYLSWFTGSSTYLNGWQTIVSTYQAIDYMVLVLNIAPQSLNDSASVIKVKRTVPSMDFVIANQNRLWGCKYGLVDGQIINAIYASKLGDPFNWYSFGGTATDSFEMTVGEGGAFTGAISYNGKPVFFKQDKIITIYGSYPAEYQSNIVTAEGVAEGSKSLAIVDGYLYYYSNTGFMRYDSYPTFIGDVFENQKLNIEAAFGCNHKYYAYDGNLYVYDTYRQIWHKEIHEGYVVTGAQMGDDYYFATKTNISLLGEGDAGEWYYESGDLAIHNPTTVSHYTSGVKASNRHQYISHLTIRAKLDAGACVNLWLAFDEGEFEPQGSISAATMDIYDIPLKPRRCHSVKLKITGKGNCKIYAITKDIEEGSV